MAFKIHPYKQGSRSARNLANALGGRVLRLAGSQWRPSARDVVINWGSSEVPSYAPAAVLNRDTTLASNKLRAFNRLREARVSIPDFYTDRQSIPQDAYPVFCRTVLSGHSGNGIVVSERPDDLVNAQLYVKYIKKREEYRIHVLRGQVVLCQRKARRTEADAVDYRIRNLANGFVFVLVNNGMVPDDAIVQSIMTVEALGLDFGAVDVIWNERQNTSYVLEVNCAPGLEERTAQAYAQAFRS